MDFWVPELSKCPNRTWINNPKKISFVTQNFGLNNQFSVLVFGYEYFWTPLLSSQPSDVFLLQLDVCFLFFTLHYEFFQHGLHGNHVLFQVACTYCNDLHGNSLGGFNFRFWLEGLFEWWWKRATTVVVFYFTRRSWQLWVAFGSVHPTRHFLLQVLLFGWRCRHLSDGDHPCDLSHTSCFYSMNPSFGDGASLAGFSREREIRCSFSELVRQHFWWPWLLWRSVVWT